MTFFSAPARTLFRIFLLCMCGLPARAQYWSLTGNAGTDSNQNFFGTTDDVDVKFRANGKLIMIMRRNGNVGIGTGAPQAKLHVNGTCIVKKIISGSITDDGSNVGIGTPIPQNRMDVAGRMAVGDNFAGISIAPPNGLIVQGDMGIGTALPANKLSVIGNADITGNTGLGLAVPVNRLDVSGATAVGESYAGSATAPANGLIVEGALGVGTASPAAALDVSADALVNGLWVGRGAGSFPTNHVVGSQALHANTTGTYNTAMGNSAMNANTTGSANTAFGMNALWLNETGNFNTGIGYSANSVGTAFDNSTGIGFDADPTASDEVYIGNASVSSIKGQVSFTTFSDRRFKKDVRDDEVKGLAFILRLRPVTYRVDVDAIARWKSEQFGERNTADWKTRHAIEQIRFSGFLAQEVEQVALETGYAFSGVDKPKNEHSVYGLRYAEFVVPLVKAVQEQQQQIERQQAENEALRNDVRVLQDRVQALAGALRQLDDDVQLCCSFHRTGSAGTPPAAHLAQNTPNPFSETTLIRYFLAGGAPGSIRVSDLGGRVITTVAVASEGYGQIELKGGTFSPGTYVYELISAGAVLDSKRMVIGK